MKVFHPSSLVEKSTTVSCMVRQLNPPALQYAIARQHESLIIVPMCSDKKQILYIVNNIKGKTFLESGAKTESYVTPFKFKVIPSCIDLLGLL